MNGDRVPLQEADWDVDQGTQEMPDNMDLASCWRVIARQTALIERQQASLSAVTNQLNQVQQQLTAVLDQQRDHNGRNDGIPNGGATITLAQLSQVLDKKGAPPPETFTLWSGRSFDRFLEQFEKYCQGKFSVSSYERWTSELGSYLKGEILNMYNQYGGSDQDMTVMKRKLKQFCQGEEEKSLGRKLEKFANARPGPDESCFMYAARLERLFMAAHPTADIENSIDLKIKFLASISRSDRNEVQRDLDAVTANSANERETNSWKKLMGIIKRQDERNHLMNPAPIKTEPTEPLNTIWFTSTNVKDANDYEDYPEYRRSRPRYRTHGGSRPRSYSRDGYGTQQPVYNTHPNRARSLSQRGVGVYGNANSSYPRQIIYCDWCGNPGHIQRNCWRKLGYCLRCGSAEHIVRNCPRPSRLNPGSNLPRHGTGSSGGAVHRNRNRNHQQQQPQQPSNAFAGSNPNPGPGPANQPPSVDLNGQASA